MQKTLLTFVDDIYEDLELWYPKIRCEEAGYAMRVAAPEIKTYKGKHGYPAKSDLLLKDVNSKDFCGLMNIAPLGPLIAAAEQHDQDAAPAREVQAVARAKVNSEFRDRSINRSPVPKVSCRDGSQASSDPDLSLLVLELIEPLSELVGLLYEEYLAIVSSRIRPVQCVFGRRSRCRC